MDDNNDIGRPDRSSPSSWREGEREQASGTDDSLSSADYPSGQSGTDESVCGVCGSPVSPDTSVCDSCQRPGESNYGPSSTRNRTVPTTSDDLDWSLDRVVGIVVEVDSPDLALSIGEIGLTENLHDTLALADDTDVDLIDDFDGEPPFPIGRGYESLPSIVAANTEEGQQLISDLAADIQPGESGRPQIYNEYGEPIDDWDDIEEIQARLDQDDTWIVTAVITQYEDTSDQIDATTMQRSCRRCQEETTHKFRHASWSPQEGEWKCIECGKTVPGMECEKERRESLKQLDEMYGHEPPSDDGDNGGGDTQTPPPETSPPRQEHDDEPEFGTGSDSEPSGYSLSDDEPPRR